MKQFQFLVYRNSSDIPSISPHKLINKQVVNLSQQISFKTEKGWQKNKMDLVCPLIEEWKVKQINVARNQHPHIIKQLSLVKFPNLKNIYLGWNKIESIEELGRVCLPTLELLCFNNNQISQMRSLRKSCWPNLNYFGIDNNKFRELSCLSLFKSPRTLYIEFYNSEVANLCDIRIFAKSGTKPKDGQLYIRSVFRIRQELPIHVLRKKFKKITTYKQIQDLD